MKKFKALLMKVQGATPAPKAKNEEEKTPVRLADIKDIVDVKTIDETMAEFKNQVEVLVSAVGKNEEYISVDASGLSPREGELHATGKKTLNLCRSMVEYEQNPYTMRREMFEDELNGETQEQRKERFLQSHASEIGQEVADAEKPLAKIAEMENQQRRAKHKKEQAHSLRDKILATSYGGSEPLPNMLHTWVYWAIVAVLLPVEGILNFAALDALKDGSLPTMFLIPVAATLSLMMAGGGHFLGSFTAAKAHKGAIASALMVCILLLGIIFYLRDAGSDFILSFINLGAVLLLTALSYLRHKDEAFFQVEKDGLTWAREEEQLGTQMFEIKKSAETETRAIYDRWNAKAAKFVRNEIKPLKTEIAKLKREESAFANFIETYIVTPINAIYFDGAQRLRSNLAKARRVNGLPLVPVNTPIKPLEGGGTPQPPPPVNMPPVELEVEPEVIHHHNGNGQASKRNGLFPWDNINMLPFLFALMMMGMGCAPDAPVQVKEVVYIGDWSIAPKDSIYLPTIDEQVSFLISQTGIETEGLAVSRDNIRLTATHIGDTRFPSVDKIELEEGKPDWKMVKSKRRTAQKEFAEQVRASIAKHGTPKGLESSHVMSCLCQVLPKLSSSDADEKTVFINSDMIEYSDTENFYSLKTRMPKGYDKIVARLDAACPPMQDVSLNGIELTAVYLPNVKVDKTAHYTREFWKRYIEDKGGSIKFLPNLPKIPSKHVAHN